MLRLLTQISRLIIGFVFILSGFVKLVDPLGTKFKMTEYFEVLNMEMFIPYALPISILLIVGELILGVMILVGYRPKLSVWSIFGLSTVFLFLTWYSYVYNAVTDCGCFGDFLKLSTRDTFYKNVVFSVLIIIMLIGIRYIKPIISRKIAGLMSFTALGLSLMLAFYVLNHLPLIDFRPYSVGTNIKEGMTKVEKGEDFPKIHDFSIETKDGNKLPEVLKASKALLVMMYDFSNANEEGFKHITKIAKQAEDKGYLVYIVTDTPEEYLQPTPSELGLSFKFGTCDGTALKTAMRSNPGIMTIENGIIIGKWSWRDADNVELK